MKRMSKVRFRDMAEKDCTTEEQQLITKKTEDAEIKQKKQSSVIMPIFTEILKETGSDEAEKIRNHQNSRSALLAEISAFKRDYNDTGDMHIRNDCNEDTRSDNYRANLQKFNDHLQTAKGNSRQQKSTEKVHLLKQIGEQSNQKKNEVNHSLQEIVISDHIRQQTSNDANQRNCDYEMAQANKQLRDRIKELEKENLNMNEKLIETVKQCIYESIDQSR